MAERRRAPDLDPDVAREAELEDSRMPFLEHLRELRVRIRNSVLALVLGFVAAFAFSDDLLALAVRPYARIFRELAATNPALGENALYYNSLIEPMWVYISMSVWAGLFISSPLIFYQLWKFIAPGLYKNERRYGVVFAGMSGVLFVAGAVFCYSFVLEPFYRFSLGLSNANISKISHLLGLDYTVGTPIALKPQQFLEQYLDLVRKLLLGFGLIFELPLLIGFLAQVGMVTHRSLWKFNRWAIVLAFIVGAILTPGTDVYSQLMMSVPIVVLYNVSILIAWAITTRKERAAAELQADEAVADLDDDDDRGDSDA